MNNVMKKIKSAKHISFFVLILLAFTYVAEFRYYINENIYSAFDLGNLGEIGKKLSVSVLVAVFCVLGWALGMLTGFLTRKKNIRVTTLYWLSGMFAIVALFFTPYNLQLLMSDTILQNIAMIACIAHIVFILVDMWIFAWALCVGSKNIYLQSSREAFIIIPSVGIIAMVLSYLTSAFTWSFSISTSIYAVILTLINIVDSFFDKDETCLLCQDAEKTKTDCIKSWSINGILTLIFLVVLIGTYFITENNIVISY